MNTGLHYRGRPVEHLTKEELVEAVYDMAERERSGNEMRERERRTLASLNQVYRAQSAWQRAGARDLAWPFNDQ